MFAWLVLACGGDDKADDGSSTGDSASVSTTDVNEGCLRRCNRGSDGTGCDPGAIGSTCDRYCVDPPPLPDECDPAFRAYESCIGPIREFTCDGSSAQIDGVTFPITVDPYECFLEARELEPPCVDVANPGCAPTLGGTGATCTADLVACSADGVTFDADMICDGTVCSMLVDGGAPVNWPRADLLCDELAELQARDPVLAAKFLVVLAGF